MLLAQAKRNTYQFVQRFFDQQGVDHWDVRAVWKQAGAPPSGYKRSYIFGDGLLHFKTMQSRKFLNYLADLSSIGFCILGRPTGQIGQHFILVDDVNESCCNEFAAHLESSHNNYQCWAFCPQAKTPVQKRAMARHLADRYDGDTNAIGYQQIGRLPFPNRKAGRNNFLPRASVQDHLEAHDVTKPMADIVEDDGRLLGRNELAHHVIGDAVTAPAPKKRKRQDTGKFDRSASDWALAMRVLEMKDGDCTPEWTLSQFLAFAGTRLATKISKDPDYAYRTVTNARYRYALKHKKSMVTYFGTPPPGYLGPQVVEINSLKK